MRRTKYNAAPTLLLFITCACLSTSLHAENIDGMADTFTAYVNGDGVADINQSEADNIGALSSIINVLLETQEPQIQVITAPSNANSLLATVLETPSFTSIGNTIGSRTTLSVSGAADGVDGIKLVLGTDNPGLIPTGSLGVVSASYDSKLSNFDQLGALGNPACSSCIEVDILQMIESNTLLDGGSFTDSGVIAHWGRWHASGSIEYLTEVYESSGDIHFIYSEDSSDLSSLGTSTTTQYNYNLSNGLGTRPSNQLGSIGNIDRIVMDINYSTQAIERFEMDLSLDSNNVWSVVMKDASVSLNGNPVSSFEVVGAFGSLAVLNTGVVFGDVNITVLGPNAEFIIGSYNLSVIDSILPAEELVGTFLLNQ